MSKHIGFSNSSESNDSDYVLSDLNTSSNTNALQSITTFSRSFISFDFDDEEQVLSSLNSDEFSDTSILSNLNQTQGEDNFIVDEIFKCKTDKCACHSEDLNLAEKNFIVDDIFHCKIDKSECQEDDTNSKREDVISKNSTHAGTRLSISKYCIEPCILSMLSGEVLIENPDINIIDKDTDVGNTYYQDCKCRQVNEENVEFTPKIKESDNESNFSELLNITYTLSDDKLNKDRLELITKLRAITEKDNSRPMSDISKFDTNQLVYFTPDEVVVHNESDDIWVSYLGNVYDITPLIAKHIDSRVVKPLLAFAGKDISDWFDVNGELRHYIHPVTGVRVPYLPHGPIPDIQPHVPTTVWKPACECIMKPDDIKKAVLPWWRSKKYFIGKLTACARPIRIVNMITLDECTLNVCCEDKLSRILERLLVFNSHASSYTFKYDTRVLDMNKTLDENHIFDERNTFVLNYLPEDTYIPALHLYFNDDLQWDLDTSDEHDD